MKATGIVRRIDDLGRVVIPKEIRRTLRIREGDPLEIFTDREGEIILKKYSPIGELAAFAGMYADSLAKEAGCLVCICDMDQVVAASGNGRKEVQEKYISKVLQGELEERNSILAKVDEKKYIRVFREQEKDYVWESITPIICEGDVVGGVILLSSDEKEKFTKLEQKLGACAAGVVKFAEAVIFAGSGSYLVVDKEERDGEYAKKYKGHMVDQVTSGFLYCHRYITFGFDIFYV